MRMPVKKPGSDLSDIRRAVAELCDLTAQLRISESSTVKVNEAPNGTLLDVKKTFGGGATTAQVWI